jgi:hypothetical protein
MTDSPPPAETPKQRLIKEYEDPHFHDDDEVAPVEDGEPRSTMPRPPVRRKPAYRPPRRFHED